ncbi:hypothetical protein Ancab_019591 [Ancistrocladus abbreviatus]
MDECVQLLGNSTIERSRTMPHLKLKFQVNFDLISMLTKREDSLVILTHVFPWRQNFHSGSFGGFALDWDTPRSQDVVLWKKCELGEEVAVSALLGLNPQRIMDIQECVNEGVHKKALLEIYFAV